MVLLFSDVFVVRRAFHEKFKEVQQTPWGVLAVCGVVGVLADLAAVFLLVLAPWAPIFTKSGGALAGGAVTVASVAIRPAIFFVSERGPRGGVKPQAAAPPTRLGC